MWWAPECLSSETWLLRNASEEGSKLFFSDCETLRKMTADRCIALGGHWCCLRTWIGSEADSHQPLVIASFTEHSWATSRGCAACYLDSSKQETVSFIFTLPHLLSSAWEHLSFDKGLQGGRVIWTTWVPMGMVDLSTAPERFIFLLYRSKALTRHDPQLIWIPETPKPELYSFFVFYVLFLFSGATT